MPEQTAEPLILLLDDEEAVLLALSKTLAAEGYQVCAEKEPHVALARLKELRFAAILSDQRMPGMTGLEFLAFARQLQPEATRILITAVLSLDTVVEAINRGEIYRFLVKPWLREELLMSVRNAIQRHQMLVNTSARQNRTQLENARLQQQLAWAEGRERELAATGDALQKRVEEWTELCVRSLETYLPVLGSQARRAHQVCVGMAEQLNLEADERQSLELAARLHDLGLLELPRALVRRWHADPASLSDTEWLALRRHPVRSAELVRFGEASSPAGNIIRCHHERFNGTGYPDQLAGEAIPWLGRLLAVAVNFAANDLDPGESARRIQLSSGEAFDPEAVRVLLRSLSRTTVLRNPAEVALSELRPGMKLARGVYAANGQLLVAEGQSLTPASIEAVRDHHRNAPLGQTLAIYC